MRSRIVWAWALGLSGLLVHACGGKVEGDVSCEPGSLKDCSSNGTAGPCFRQCLPSGDGYSDCECGPPPPMGGYGGAGGSPYGGGGMPYGGGGYPYGGSGGDPWGGGGYPGGSGGMPCPGCPGYKLGGLLEMKPCCPPNGACGAVVESTVGQLVGLPPGCYPTDQPGMPDPSCGSLLVPNPLDGGTTKYPGCCNPNTGTCGALVDLKSFGGPYFGCANFGAGGGGPQKCGGSTGNCDQCVEMKCAMEMKSCLGTPACAAIIDCMQTCSSQVCADKCIASYPGGKQAFYDFVNCVGVNCQTECQ